MYAKNGPNSQNHIKTLLAKHYHSNKDIFTDIKLFAFILFELNLLTYATTNLVMLGSHNMF